jgi:hypothetical protein
MLSKGTVVCGNETAQRELLKLVRAASRDMGSAAV